MTNIDSNRNLVAAIAYIPIISFLSAIAIYFVEKEDKFIRFHALQAILLSLVYFVVSLILGNLPLGSALNGLIFLGFLAIWLYSMYKAWL
ncbi:MAG: hypothetical protein WD988_03305, partial [Candidatus Curtissbacteria bacterium]